MKCLKSLKDLLTWQEVIGRMQRIIRNTLMLGKKLEILGNVQERVRPSELYGN